MEGEGKLRGWPLFWAVVRRSTAVAIAGFAVIWWATSVRSPTQYGNCRQEVASVGTDSTVTICNHLGVQDLAPLAIPIVGLLIWDFSEIGIAGLVTLKRRVEMQEQRTQAVENQIQALSVGVLAVGQYQEHKHYYFEGRPLSVDELRQGLDQLDDRFPPRPGGDSPGGPEETKP
jgi:hypothetical protein